MSPTEPTPAGPDIIELSESPSRQNCHPRPASLDLEDPFSSPSQQLRTLTELEPTSLTLNVAGAVCHREVMDEADIKEEPVEPVEPAEWPRIIAKLHSPSPSIILSLLHKKQSRRQKTALIKRADHLRVQRDLEEHSIREVGEARFLTGSYKVQRQIQDDLERDSHKRIKKGRVGLNKLKRRMEKARKREYEERRQRHEPKKHRAQQQMSAGVTHSIYNQRVSPQSCLLLNPCKLTMARTRNFCLTNQPLANLPLHHSRLQCHIHKDAELLVIPQSLV